MQQAERNRPESTGSGHSTAGRLSASLSFASSSPDIRDDLLGLRGHFLLGHLRPLFPVRKHATGDVVETFGPFIVSHDFLSVGVLLQDLDAGRDVHDVLAVHIDLNLCLRIDPSHRRVFDVDAESARAGFCDHRVDCELFVPERHVVGDSLAELVGESDDDGFLIRVKSS